MNYLRLSEIATYSQGKQVEPENQFTCNKDGLLKRFIRIVDYTNHAEPIRYVQNFGQQYIVDKNDVVIIRYGSQSAGMAVHGLQGIIANNMFKINFNQPYNKCFAYYYLSRPEIYKLLRSGQSSSTMPAITFSNMNNILIPNISLEEQQYIVNTIRT